MYSLKTNAILNMIRKGCSILFPVITFSYASHKLGAAGIGSFSFCNSVISYFLLFAALGVDTYAVREGQAVRDDKKKLSVFISEVYTVNVIMTIASYIILGLLAFVWSKMEGYRELLFLLSISIAMTTIGTDWVNTLLEDYLYITVRFIGIQVFCLIMLIILVKEPSDIYKYACISVTASVGGNAINVWYIRRRIPIHIQNMNSLKKHLIPMVTLFSNSLAIKIYLIADITIIGIMMTDKDVGYYTVASKVYTSIKEMINAMILVTVPRFSLYLSRGEGEKYRQSYNGVINGVVTLLLPSMVGLFFQAGNIVYYLGGPEYIKGASSLKILSIAMFFAVGACLLAQSVLIPNKLERQYLKATIVAAISNIVLNFLMIPYWGINAAAATTLLSELIVFSLMAISCRSIAPSVDFSKSDILSACIGSGGIAVICILANCYISNRLYNMIASILFSIIVYAMLILIMKNKTATLLLKGLFKK